MTKQPEFRLVGFSVLMMFMFPVMASTSVGENVYSLNCMVCHGDDGSGELPGVPDLLENNAWQKRTEAEVLERLTQGIQGKNGQLGMPAKGGNPKLTRQELESSFRYLQTITKK